MAITLLASFYHKVIIGENNSVTAFIELCKVLGAFYTLWRSAKSNAGLDNVYREFFKGTKDSTHSSKCWLKQKYNSIDEIKSYLRKVLEREGISTLEQWLPKATKNLKYNSTRSVCKFALYVSAHETIPDQNNLGLMKKGMYGTSPYLILHKWNSDDLKTIEHIAPQDDKNKLWDQRLYEDEDELYQLVGNLTLLPNNVNISASNKGWEEKLLYYKHLSEKDPQIQQELANKALYNGFELSSQSIELLQNAHFNEHITSIVTLEKAEGWSAELVEKRTERVCEILWGRVSKWIFE